MSKGRYDFGVGRSITEAELGGFRIEPKDSRPMLEEVLPEIVKMWTQDPYPGFEGQYFSMPERPVVPKPVQDPHPPYLDGLHPARLVRPCCGSRNRCARIGSALPEMSSTLLKRYKERLANTRGEMVGKFVNNAVAPATLMFSTRKTTSEALDVGAVAALWYGAQTAKLFPSRRAGTAGQRVTNTTDSSRTTRSS